MTTLTQSVKGLFWDNGQKINIWTRNIDFSLHEKSVLQESVRAQ